jgi:outer membrane protein assembly factor BamB
MFRSLLIVCVCTLPAFGSDWSQFRGPNGTGVSSDNNLPTKWSKTEGFKFKVEIPARGISCPVIVGDRVYLTANSGKENRILHTLCYHAETGELLWHRTLRATGLTDCHPKTNMAAPTPVATADAVYALFATADLAAYDKDGNLLWYRSLVGDYPTVSNQVGMASSPILWKDVLVVPMDNSGESFLAGIDIHYGKNIWKTERPRETNWVTPTLRTEGDQAEVIFQDSTGVTAYQAATGKKAWTYAGEAGTIASPIVSGKDILVPVRGLDKISLDGNKPKATWKSIKIRASSATPLVYKDWIFAISSPTTLLGADLKTGDVKFQERLKGQYWASPIAGDDKVYVFSDTGVTTVVKIAETPEVLASNDIGEEILGTPAIANSRIYIRTDKHLYCIGK